MESIEEGLNKKHGRPSKKDQDQEYGSSQSLEATFDDRGTARRVLDGVHDTVTHDYSVGTALVAGATAILEKSGQMDIEALNQVALQYPEASNAAMVAGAAAIAYEASDKFGIQASAGEVAEYVKDALSGEEEYLDLGEELGEDDRIQARDRRVGIDPESIDLEEAEELAEQIEGFEVFEDKDEVSRL
jgi:hypothetical protein